MSQSYPCAPPLQRTSGTTHPSCSPCTCRWSSTARPPRACVPSPPRPLLRQRNRRRPPGSRRSWPLGMSDRKWKGRESTCLMIHHLQPTRAKQAPSFPIQGLCCFGDSCTVLMCFYWVSCLMSDISTIMHTTCQNNQCLRNVFWDIIWESIILFVKMACQEADYEVTDCCWTKLKISSYAYYNVVIAANKTDIGLLFKQSLTPANTAYH